MTSLITFDTLPAEVLDHPAAERCIGTPPLRRTQSVYQGDAGAVDCGIWASEPGTWRIHFHAGRHEYFYVIDGRLRISDENGVSRTFGPGDACIIPAGFKGLFEVLEPVKKHYVMIDRKTDA
jgi:hypothetical protein